MSVRNASEFEKIINMKSTVMLDGKERINFILRSLIEAAFLGNALKQQRLADELYISLSTLKSNLREVKLTLEHYDIGVVNFKNSGMTLEGAERDRSRQTPKHPHSSDVVVRYHADRRFA